MVRFHNSRSMVECMRAGAPYERVVVWDGPRIFHPSDRSGLAEAIVELLAGVHIHARFYR